MALRYESFASLVVESRTCFPLILRLVLLRGKQAGRLLYFAEKLLICTIRGRPGHRPFSLPCIIYWACSKTESHL